MKKTVVIGLLGPTLDTGMGVKRWERWRPTICLCQHEDLLINQMDLLYQQRFSSLKERIMEDIHHLSPETDIMPHRVEFKDPWDFEEVYAALHDFAKNYPFDTEKNDYLIHITTGSHVAQICLFLLTESRRLPGKLIQTSPPAKKQLRSGGCGEYRIIDLDLSRYDRIAMRFNAERDDDISRLKSGIETKNTSFNALIEKIETVAVQSVDPILLTGPTGAGKSNLARRIYELKASRRKVAGAFIEVNCATIRGDVAMSTLFGHKKGAFTGALNDREGLLRSADGGMLFLDEVGELGSDEQSMLLRAIEEKTFLPMGSDKESSSDFQLICGTNRDLQKAVKTHEFREDLLARINLWSFPIPGLKDRREDIEPNLSYELDRFAEKNNIRVTFNKEARLKFLKFATHGGSVWSANFRDLNGAVIRMATLAPGGRITPKIVDEEILRLRSMWGLDAPPEDGVGILRSIMEPHEIEDLDHFQKNQLKEVIRICRTSKNMSEAGRKLFAVSREKKKKSNDSDRLRKYLSRYGIAWKDISS